MKHELSSNLMIVITTEVNDDKAKSLAKELLHRKLAACINLSKVESYFWWDQKLENNSEFQLLIKTTENKLKELLSLIRRMHTYDVPELIFWKADSSESYRLWVEEVT